MGHEQYWAQIRRQEEMLKEEYRYSLDELETAEEGDVEEADPESDKDKEDKEKSDAEVSMQLQ